MMMLCKKMAPIFMFFIAFTLFEAGLTAEFTEAKSFGGGRSFKMTPRTPTKSVAPTPTTKQGGSTFGRGLAGGLLGGGIGGMLFGWLLIRYWQGKPPFKPKQRRGPWGV